VQDVDGLPYVLFLTYTTYALFILRTTLILHTVAGSNEEYIYIDFVLKAVWQNMLFNVSTVRLYM